MAKVKHKTRAKPLGNNYDQTSYTSVFLASRNSLRNIFIQCFNYYVPGKHLCFLNAGTAKENKRNTCIDLTIDPLKVLRGFSVLSSRTKGGL